MTHDANQLIQNHGLYWRRDRVEWGRTGKAGHMYGKDANARNSKPVDIREQKGVYALYDANFNLVYVGQAGRQASRGQSRKDGGNPTIFSRLKAHRNDHLGPRWTYFSWFGLLIQDEDDASQAHFLKAEDRTVDIGVTLNHLEAILIIVAEPPLNRQGGTLGSSVEQFLQCDADGNLFTNEPNSEIAEMASILQTENKALQNKIALLEKELVENGVKFRP